jgi:hypothetical protein
MLSKNTKTKFERYEDPTGEFSNRSLKLAEWYLRHKILLKKIGVTTLVLWSVVTLGYSVGYFGYYMAVGYSQDQLMYARQTIEFQDYTVLQPLYKPQEIQIKKVSVFNSAKNKYDFVAKAFNPNERWVAYINFHFVYRGGQTVESRAVLLPGEERPLIFFGEELDYSPGGAELVFVNVEWKNVNKHTINDVQSFVQARKRFEFDNFEFIRADRTEGIFASRVKFDLYNNSAYSFWQPEFFVELLSDKKVVGYLYFVEDKFRNGDERNVDIISMFDSTSITNIKIHSITNVFSLSEYMDPGQE